MKLLHLTRDYAAMVDDSDYEDLAQHRRHPTVTIRKDGTKNIYAKRTEYLGIDDTSKPRFRAVLMHRAVLGLTGRHPFVDHWDGVGLNNQRENLRIASHAENMQNARGSRHGASAHKGVNKHGKKWQAEVKKDSNRYFLGTFKEECDAALAYNLKAEELFGEFAFLNTPI